MLLPMKLRKRIRRDPSGRFDLKMPFPVSRLPGWLKWPALILPDEASESFCLLRGVWVGVYCGLVNDGHLLGEWDRTLEPGAGTRWLLRLICIGLLMMGRSLIGDCWKTGGFKRRVLLLVRGEVSISYLSGDCIGSLLMWAKVVFQVYSLKRRK